MDRYEKALELARSYYDKDANTFLDTIFPELKESRNEQIRKAIIKSLDMPFPEDNLPGTDVTYAEAVAWLKSLHPSWKPSEEQMEVDLEKEPEEEIERFYRTDEYRIADTLGRGFETLARHFTEWGLNARKEDK